MRLEQVIEWHSRHSNAKIHSGTTADVALNGSVKSLYLKRVTDHTGAFKTVNITSFSSESWSVLGSYIDQLISAGQDQIFYEQAIQDLIQDGKLSFECVDFTNIWWDEVDSVEDLDRVTFNIRQLAEIEA